MEQTEPEAEILAPSFELTFGPEEAPGIVRVPVRWAPEGDVVGRIWLPVVQRGHERP